MRGYEFDPAYRLDLAPADPGRVAEGLELQRRLGREAVEEQRRRYAPPPSAAFTEGGASIFGELKRPRSPPAPLPPLAERAAEGGASGAMRGVKTGTLRAIAGDLGIPAERVPTSDLRRSIVRALARRFDSRREMVAFLARYGVGGVVLEMVGSTMPGDGQRSQPN